ncbi:MAG: TonB-dependent receptor [Nitrospirae bacterium]|nr:TonB-dependent receptor [Nitrospirota bacterium]
MYKRLSFFVLILLCFVFLLFPCYIFADSGDKATEVRDKAAEIREKIMSSEDKDEEIARKPSYLENEEEFIIMRYGKDAAVLTPTRYLKPVSQVAENMTVITSDIIRQMNAHTVADVLNGVTGVQIEPRFAFSHGSTINMQGAPYEYVRVLIDGVTLNDLQNFARIGDIPVQMIDRIEIIKGPASSSWGSSLGGVINIITKTSLPIFKVGGMLSASYGEKSSGDYRAEAGGKVSNLNYYVYGGHLDSNGFSPHSADDDSSFYTKERLDITDKVNVQYTLGYNNVKEGMGAYPQAGHFSQDNKNHNIFTTLTITDSIADQVTLSLAGRYINMFSYDKYNSTSSGALLKDITDKETSKGATFNLNWTPEDQTIIFGSEYDDGVADNTALTGKKSLIKSAVFVNDTIKNLIKDIYITPGLRFDNISTNGSFLSPSLGITYSPSEFFTYRFDAARGFNVPSLAQIYGTGLRYLPNPNLKVEKVWSYQTGIETTMLRYAWLKLTVFRHEVDNGITIVPVDASHSTSANYQKQRRQGLEVEMESFPFYNVSFSSGYSFVDTKDLKTEQRLSAIIRHTVDVGLRYKKDTFMAYLFGHYLVWDNVPSYYIYTDKSFVFNLNVVKKFYKNEINRNSVDVFLTGHNLFNASQHWTEINNPRRWIEGGIRLNF